VANARARKRTEAVFSCRYVNDQSNECRYCGAPAETRDHVPPLRYAAAQIAEKHGPWRLVSACAECNSLLGARPLLTITDRRRFLLGKYRERFAKLLAGPRWTERDFAELGASLQSAVRAQETQRQRAIARLQHLQTAYPVETDFAEQS
jgi:hypothetical protein